MKVSHGKNDPSRALYCINHFELSEVTLSFVEWCIHFGNGTCHLQVFIPQNPPFASPNIAGLSVTHSGYWHPLLPAMSPQQSPSQKPQFIPQKPPIQNSKEFKIFQQRRVELSSLKKKREAHSPFQVANYGVQISSNEAIHSIHSIPSKNPMFHETWIWQSTDPVLDHPSAKQYR